jgi:hypothetical protein
MVLDGLNSRPLSRIFAVVSVGMSVLLYFGMLDTYQLYFNPRLILDKHEFWRPFTSILCFGPLGFSAVIHIYTLVAYSLDVEGHFFGEQPADFLLFSLFGWVVIWTFAMFQPLLFLGASFSSYVMYYWAKRSPDAPIMLLGLPFPFHAPWLPVLLVLTTYRRWPLLMINLVGFAAAHVYFVLRDVFRIKYNLRLFWLPDSFNQGLKNLLS